MSIRHLHNRHIHRSLLLLNHSFLFPPENIYNKILWDLACMCYNNYEIVLGKFNCNMKSFVILSNLV